MQALLTTRMPKALVFLVLGAVALPACDDDNSTNKSGINSLPGCFEDAFDRDANAEPIDASECELTVRPTIEPFNP